MANGYQPCAARVFFERVVMRTQGVGKSSRTPFKHFLLNEAVGKIVGVLALNRPQVPCKANPFLMVDLCGGDGHEPEDGSHKASPKILNKHGEYLLFRGFGFSLDVIEKDCYTFEKLVKNCEYMNTDRVSLINGDARQYRLPTLKSNQAAFVHCDPNAVSHMPLTGPFVDSWNRHTNYLVTLGCNVGGAKRLSYDERLGWFEYIRMLTDHLPKHHDAMLFWLQNDASMWAYLLSFPATWAKDFQSMATKKASGFWPKGVGAASYRTQRAIFDDQVKQLFLTKEEYNGNA
jgi:hypothetical protein